MHFCISVHLLDLRRALPLMFSEGNKWSEGSVKFSGSGSGALALIRRLSQTVWALESQKLSPLAFSNTIYLCHFACRVYLSL